ncbi:MAG: single-stranded DNA-binding protein [Acidimicrobiales bacterium]
MVNIVVLRGRMSRPAAERVLPSGDRLAVLDLTVPGTGSDAAKGKAESVPLAWFDAPTWVSALDVGAELVVVGRVRRRFFRTGASVQSRTEVVVEAAVPARRTARAAELVRRASDAITRMSDT